MSSQVDVYTGYLSRAAWSMARVVLERAENRVDLVVEAVSAGDPTRLQLRFLGVTGLELRQQWDNFPLGLQVVDMTADGWEGVRYRVTDPEYDILALWCAEFEVGTPPPAGG